MHIVCVGDRGIKIHHSDMGPSTPRKRNKASGRLHQGARTDNQERIACLDGFDSGRPNILWEGFTKPHNAWPSEVRLAVRAQAKCFGGGAVNWSRPATAAMALVAINVPVHM
jgi:hypothetical protein